MLRLAETIHEIVVDEDGTRVNLFDAFVFDNPESRVLERYLGGREAKHAAMPRDLAHQLFTLCRSMLPIPAQSIVPNRMYPFT